MGEATVFAVLKEQAEQTPDAPVLLIDGEECSRAELFESVKAIAAGLRALGLDRGDRGLIVSDNRLETVVAWLGVDCARMIDVPINPEARGAFLEYLVRDCGPRVMIGLPAYLRAVAEVVPEPPEFAVLIDPDDGELPFGPSTRHLTFGELRKLGRDRAVEPPLESDVATMIYTSGTTGPSKGVLLPHAYQITWARRGAAGLGMRAGQTAYTPEPLFHSDARSYVLAALLTGGRLALGKRFSVSRFWDEVRAADASYFAYLGTMLSMLNSAEPSAADRDHPAVIGTGGGAPAALQSDFEERFGVRLIEMYGMTEALCITQNTPEHSRVGSVGLPTPELEVRLVDDQDRPVPAGEIGELILRPREPHTVMAGYWNKPEATVSAWRNLWFHTGDRMRADEDGFLYYIGRLKDSIRRRGENVSAWEVECAANKHEDVREAAAIGVPSELGEEDLALLVVAQDAGVVDPAALRDFLAADLPKHAVPRFIEVVEELPKTPTQRVNKDEVRARGITEAAWDGEKV
ncbi:AMP-binding protein [Amycolatopsis anabasis]|uniref:AMP-binding protein n=1 Tax=Amycolatopsis anabasis TaxID=1840409 RepID=UPI00131EC5E6|nr:AMP-binding protein [Amycolatopsis anabasis]